MAVLEESKITNKIIVSFLDGFNQCPNQDLENLVDRKNKIDGLNLLGKIATGSLKAVFFDPQYRGILDKMSYGNEGVSRGKERSALPQMNEEMIINFLREIERVLKRNGYLFLWVDKFHLVEGIKSWFVDLPSLAPVDMIVWDKEKMGMGYRSRRESEYLVILQKEPRQAKITWSIHNIPDVWKEKIVKVHPHSKPVSLQKLLIEAVTVAGDWVCDPAAGGYSVLEACRQSDRHFIGGDLIYGEDVGYEN